MLVVLAAVWAWAQGMPGAAGQVEVRSELARAPTFVIRSSPGASDMARRLEAYDGDRLVAVMRAVGLVEPGPPISIDLALETDDLAEGVPPWVAGYAVASAHAIVIFPERAPSYPDDSFDDVLLHEVAHVLVYRAAGGHWVPRWFSEGMAMTAERMWSIEDRARVTAGRLIGPPMHPADTNRLFDGGRSSSARAYAWSGAFVRYLLTAHGPRVGARLLAEVATGTPFDDAFRTVTGQTLDSATEAFARQTALWNRWIPFLTSTVVLWIGITMLALYAIRQRHAARAAQREAWDELEPPDEPPPTVH